MPVGSRQRRVSQWETQQQQSPTAVQHPGHLVELRQLVVSIARMLMSSGRPVPRRTLPGRGLSNVVILHSKSALRYN